MTSTTTKALPRNAVHAALPQKRPVDGSAVESLVTRQSHVTSTHVGSIPFNPNTQTEALAETIRRPPADVVLIATPSLILPRLVDFDQPALGVYYALQVIGTPTLAEVLPHVADAKSVKPAL